MNITFLGIAMLCVLGIVIAASIALVTLLLKSARRKQKLTQVPSLDKVSSTPAFKKWQGWLLPIGISLILCIWSVVYALFFLFIVWIMRLDPTPNPKEIPFPSDKDRKRAKGTYTWLLVSPFLNVLIFVFAAMNLSSSSSANERVVATLIPLIFHLPVLSKLDSKSPFVFRHTQQAVFLLALRTSTAALALSLNKNPDDGIWLFFVANGLLWLIGSLWGRGQAHRGTGWWIKRKGQQVLEPNDIPITKPIVNEGLDAMLKSLNAEGNNARQIALNAFRTGTPEARKKAVLVLTELGEVENF